MTSTRSQYGTRFNSAPPELNPQRELPAGFMEFLLPLHRDLTPRQQMLRRRRAEVLQSSHRGQKPNYLPASEATTTEWTIPLPHWCADQRNQMTGPADDAELVVKMLNSGAPGVMLDLEDSMANTWSNLQTGVANIDKALRGELTYHDTKRDRTAGIDPSNTVTFVRPRGLHISQAGVFDNELISASLFDVALVTYLADVDRLRHPVSFYIPKSESAEEALWWRDLFRAIEDARGWPRGYIKCMALVESHPIAFQMEEFIYNLRDHIIGLNLGRWDYMASLIHFNLEDPEWVLPDRNTIPHDVPFFQNLRELLAETCHKHGILAIGGMTALYPSRTDPELNDRALSVLAADKKNEANCLMDGAWTGHPDQNEIAVQQFPFPNQVHARKPSAPTHPDLRPIPTANLAGHMYPDQSLYPGKQRSGRRAQDQPVVTTRRPDRSRRGTQRYRLVRADRRRCRGWFRWQLECVRIDEGEDRSRRGGSSLRRSARVREEVRPHGRQGARADAGVYSETDRRASRSRRAWCRQIGRAHV